jgi:hypothetical protein
MGTPDARRTERGATAVVVALLLVVMASFLALVMNVGHLQTVRAQLHNATDSAALAAARELNGTLEGLAEARRKAVDYASRHATDSLENPDPTIRIDADTDVIFGHWYSSRPRDSAFEEILGRTPADLNRINAVLVRDGREAARGNDVKTISGLFDRKATDVTAESVAVLGGPTQDGCPLVPLAFSSCAVTDLDGVPLCDKPLTFHSDLNDTIGFTNLAPDAGVSTADLKAILTGSCRPVSTGDPISVSNGANLQPLVGLWPLNEPVQAPVVELPDCKFNSHDGSTTVLGFVTVTITDVQPAPDLSITVQVDCQMSPVASSGFGGPNLGTTATSAGLVR